jgi:O-antigen/teichoic acid export membrane protein
LIIKKNDPGNDQVNCVQTSIRDVVSREHGALSLRKNFVWTLTGNVIYAACQWCMLIVLAKFSTPEMIGRFALGLAIAAPIIIFTNLALRTIQATDARRDYLFSAYLKLRLMTTLLAVVMILAVILVGSFSVETARVILIIGLAKGFEAIGDIFYGLFQQHERMDLIAKSMIIKGSFSLVMFSAGVYLTQGVWGGAIGLTLAWSVILFVYDVPNGGLILNMPVRTALLQARLDCGTFIKLTRLALPLGITAMLISLNSNIPRYFIEHFLGERELGFFAAIAYLMVAGTIIVNALGQSTSPRLAIYYAKGKIVRFRVLLMKLLGIAVMLGAAGILIVSIAGKEILTVFYRDEFGVYTNVFVWLMIAAAIQYIASFLGYGLIAAHYYRIQPFIFGPAIALSAILCFIWIPRWGILGAVWAIGLSALGQMLASLACLFHAIYVSGKLQNFQPE